MKKNVATICCLLVTWIFGVTGCSNQTGTLFPELVGKELARVALIGGLSSGLILDITEGKQEKECIDSFIKELVDCSDGTKDWKAKPEAEEIVKIQLTFKDENQKIYKCFFEYTESWREIKDKDRFIWVLTSNKKFAVKSKKLWQIYKEIESDPKKTNVF